MGWDVIHIACVIDIYDHLYKINQCKIVRDFRIVLSFSNCTLVKSFKIQTGHVVYFEPDHERVRSRKVMKRTFL